MTVPAISGPPQPWGEALRAWRAEVKGWSQEELVEHLRAAAWQTNESRGHELDEKTVRRWENGQSRPQGVYRRLLAYVGAPLPPPSVRSAPVLPPDSPPTPRLAPDDEVVQRRDVLRAGGVGMADHDQWEASSLSAADVLAQVTRRDLSLNRRELGQLFAKVLLGGALIDRLERWFSTPAAASPAAATRGSSIGYQELSELETAARVFRNWDDQFGGGLRRKAVIGQLNEVADLVRESHPADMTQRLHSILAELAETAATMSWDTGQQAVAQRYYLMALHAARTAGDDAFAANIMGGGMARQLLYLGEPHDALELVRLAQRVGDGAETPAVRSMLSTREAWAYSALGRTTAFERAAARAEDELATVSADAPEPHWIGYYNAGELHGTLGGRLLELAHHDSTLAAPAAIRIREALDARGPGHLRSTALDEIGLAEALMLGKDHEQAVTVGHRALDVAAQTGSDRVRVQLGSLAVLARDNADDVTVRGLHDRIREVTTSSAKA